MTFMSNTCAKAQGRNIIFFHVGVISSKLTIPFKLKLFQTNSWWSYCQFNINFLSSFECISHKDKMFSYYGQRENFDYPGNTVVLDAKIKNLETSHINLDLWIFTQKKTLQGLGSLHLTYISWEAAVAISFLSFLLLVTQYDSLIDLIWLAV